MSKKANHKGFTLIELLVVVAIIALLIAILLPSLGKAREQAKKSVCLSNLKALGQGCHVYAAAWDDMLPPEFRRGLADYYTGNTYNVRDTTAGVNTPSGYGTAWGLAILNATDTVTDTRVYFCPALVSTTFGLQEPNASLKSWKDPTGQFFRVGLVPINLGYQYQLHSTYNPDQGGNDQTPPVPGTTSFAAGNFVAAAYPRLAPFPQGFVLASDITYASGTAGQTGYTNTTPHDSGGGINALFVDGHAATVDDASFKTYAGPDSTTNIGMWARMDRILKPLERSGN